MNESLFIPEIGKICIVAGHYGSGKTNIAVNLAIAAKQAYPDKAVCTADLDIVNPYFRTADAADILKKHGIEPLIPEFANSNVDIPSLPEHMMYVMRGEMKDGVPIVDVGGDDGAVVLGMYSDDIMRAGYEMYYVVNMYRPLISTAENAYLCMKDIENSSGLKCTKMINNSSLGRETTPDVIFESIDYAHECAKLCGIPLVGHTYCIDIVPDTPVYFHDHGAEADKETLIPIVNITKKLF